jgi:hypothetical protein
MSQQEADQDHGAVPETLENPVTIDLGDDPSILEPIFRLLGNRNSEQKNHYLRLLHKNVVDHDFVIFFT